MDLNVLLVALAMLGVAFLVGLPLSFAFAGTERDQPDFIRRVGYMAPLLGYGVLILAVYTVSQALVVGTGAVARPVTALLLAGSLIFMAGSAVGRDVLRHFRGKTAWGVAIAALAVAGAHVLIPILTGHWLMAYATGDDAARWYMIINYFQDHPWVYGTLTEETLLFPMRDRAAYAMAGAAMASLFGIKAHVAYSATAVVACMLIAVAMCALYEITFGVRSQRERLLLWAAAGLFTGGYPAYTNIYYTGYLTHHFSAYPVLAALCYGLVANRLPLRFGWFALWSVLLTHFYTVRYPFTYGMAVGFMLLLERFAGKYNNAGFMANLGVLVLAVVAGVVSGIGELLVYGMSMDVHSFWKALMLQKNPGYYGGGWTLLEKIWRLSGNLPIYAPVDAYGKLVAYAGALVIIATAVLALYWAWRKWHQSPAYAGIMFYNATLAGALQATGGSYVLFKTALYWPSFIFIGIFSFFSSILSAPETKRRRLGYGLAAFAMVGTLLSGWMNLSFYWDMVADRYTKVDASLLHLRDKIAGYYAGCPTCTDRRIYGLDYSAERHLLMREMFRDYRWQPVRGPDLNFENELPLADKAGYQGYAYDSVLYTPTFKCEFLDMTGNRNALVAEQPPFLFYGKNASVVEYIKGFEIKPFGGYDEKGRCNRYALVTTEDSMLLRFVNKGKHDWLRLEFAAKELPTGGLPGITVKAGVKVIDVKFQSTEDGLYRSSVVLQGLSESPMIEWLLDGAGGKEGQIAITKVDWGYGDTLPRAGR